MRVAVVTRQGSGREVNQDRVVVNDTVVDSDQPTTTMFTLECPSVVAVLDGLGGHPAGDIAAALAAEIIASQSSQVETEQDVIALVEKANQLLYDTMLVHKGLRNMGTTIAGVLVNTDTAIVFWVGDSRVYVHTGDHLTQVTVDDWEEGYITQTLGGYSWFHPIQVRTTVLPLGRGRILAATDGLFGRTNRDTLAEAMNGPLETVPDQLSQVAIRSGNTDDFTVAVVEPVKPQTITQSPRPTGVSAGEEPTADDSVPSYEGENLVNLVAELEIRLTGQSPTRGLRGDLAGLIPDRRHYVLVIADGLGESQLAHPGADRLRLSRRAVLKAPFPTTTTVGLSSVATGLTPLQHGVIGYTQWIPSVGRVVNMLQWTSRSWGRFDYDPTGFLPVPNLWERLNNAGVRPVVVLPSVFRNSPFSNMLYRGAKLYGYSLLNHIRPWGLLDERGRTLIMVYLPSVDMAAHRYGQQSREYSMALWGTGRAWDRLAGSLPSHTGLIGTADHGHCDIPAEGKITPDSTLIEGMEHWGDGRVVMFNGPPDRIKHLADRTGAYYLDAERLREWLGVGDPHPELADFPTAALLAPPDTVILPDGMGAHLVGHHGGITPQELLIPLLVA